MNFKKIIELTEYRKSMSKIEREAMNAEAKKRKDISNMRRIFKKE